MDIYVGNLPFGVTDEQLRQLFEQYGGVASAKVIMDRETQRSRGFGFVRMEDPKAAQEAIHGLNEYAWESDGRSRNLNVREAEPRPQGAGNRPADRRFDGGRQGNGGGGRRERW